MLCTLIISHNTFLNSLKKWKYTLYPPSYILYNKRELLNKEENNDTKSHTGREDTLHRYY
ncbi:hypothetical protein bcgnr5390_33800 [Bacillus luti]